MIVVDVETTGTEASKHSLLSIGAVDFSDQSRVFHEECRMWDGAHVLDEALAINGFTHEQISDPKKQTEGALVANFLAWAEKSADHTVAGLNPFLDVDFIKWGAMRNHLNFILSKRSIDLHSVCYFHMVSKGIQPPTAKNRTDLNGDKIMVYVGIPTEPKPHIALNGAKWEAEAFSRLMHNRGFFKEFEKYPVPWHNSSQ